MQVQLTDDYIEQLPTPAYLSTANSESSLDDLSTLKQTNDFLKKELEKMTEEYRLTKKLADQQVEKDLQIAQLKVALEKMTEERDKLKQKLSEIRANQPIHKPVPNPLQTALVNHLLAREAIKSKEVEEIMRSIDRGEFATKDPYVDRPQQIAFNTTISAPHMHAIQLEILKDCLKGAKRAVDIGTGSGFVALSMAKMMKGDDIKVYALDHIPKLVEQARENISKSHKEYLDSKKIELLVADGREGLPQYAPFDVIFVGGSVKEIPEVFFEQLAPGGSMVVPVGEYFQNLTVVHKSKSGKIEQEAIMSVLFGKLQSVEEQFPDIDEEVDSD